MNSKFRILVVALILSTLLNAAGITFFCLFLSAESHIKSIKRSNRQLANQLTIIKAATLVGQRDAANGDFTRRSFISHYDGEQDYFAVSPPVVQGPSKSVTLIVYLHGQGATCLEPFMGRTGQSMASHWLAKNNSTVVLSCNFRLASWGNRAATADITQNIRELCQQYPVTKIVMLGTSMGGCVAPTYAALAPTDIKDKIVGVVSVEGAGDLISLYKTTNVPAVQEAMSTAIGGTADQLPHEYAAKSLLPDNIHHLPPGVKFAVISGQRDEVVPPALQKEMVRQLRQSHIQTKLIELNIPHGTPTADVYQQALDFVLS